jgi:hypothetical protein
MLSFNSLKRSQIDEPDRERAALAPGALQRGLELVVELEAVGQAGERVVRRDELERSSASVPWWCWPSCAPIEARRSATARRCASASR